MGRVILKISLPALERKAQEPRKSVELRRVTASRIATRALLFETEVYVERLCALIWKPRVNTVHYHGLFAAGSAWRAEVVLDGVRRQKRARLRRAQGKRLGVNERWMPWLSMLSHVFGHDEPAGRNDGPMTWSSALGG